MKDNQSTPQISVIVPVYNVEKYLRCCIDSILAQTFTDFELLLIDDGSKDDSGKICDEYAQKDKRIKVFHKENGGVSAARNLGINQAAGEYIAFIDSDDYVDADYLEILMRGYAADLVVTGYAEFNERQTTGDVLHSESFTDACYTDEQFKDCLPQILNKIPMRTPWDKLFKRSIIKENDIYFNQLIRFTEDTVFVQTYLLYCHTIQLRKGTPYHYYKCIAYKDSFFKYNLQAKEYIYTLRAVLQTYKKLGEKIGFTDSEYYSDVNRSLLIAYYKNIHWRKFTFDGYTDYKQTIRLVQPEVSPNDKLYALSYHLARKGLYFLSFFILRFVYPVKFWLKTRFTNS